MATQLLGAQANLNAPGGKPGAAPAVFQGGANVNGLLNVVQSATGGSRAVYITDGNPSASENSVAIFCDQSDTLIDCKDNGKSASIRYSGAVGLLGQFSTSAPLAVPELRTNILLPPVGGISTVVNVGDVLNPAVLKVVNTATGGVQTAIFTDGGIGALENSVEIFNDQISTSIQMKDSGSAGILKYEGTLPAGVTGADAGLFTFTKPMNVSTVQVPNPGVVPTVVPAGFGCGTFTLAAGASGTVNIPGLTATSVVLLTPVNNVGSFYIDTRGAGSLNLVWSSGAAATFNFFVAAY